MLRIIGGKAKGRLIKVPKGQGIRPTSDRVRESIFNIIPLSLIRGANVLDLFAGSGAIGLEALSRGAAHVTFIESNRKYIKTIKENINLCGFSFKNIDIISKDVLTALGMPVIQNLTYDIVFADPPYNYSSWRILLSKISLNVNINNYGLIIAEHSTRVSIPLDIDTIMIHNCYTYGDTSLTVFKKHGADSYISRDL